FGAEGVGLCRTEHMFLGDRRELVERLILARTDGERAEALAALPPPQRDDVARLPRARAGGERREALPPLQPLQRDDFLELFREMNGLPVTVRLLDPPLHEFLPSLADLAVEGALGTQRGQNP